MKKIYILVAFLILGCGENGSNKESQNKNLVVDENGTTTFNNSELNKTIHLMDNEKLSQDEIDSLKYLREEEKLAYDTYLTLYNKYNVKIFNNIARSEMTHTEAVKTLIEKYEIEDPVTTYENVGVFEDDKLQELYDKLIAKATNKEEALKVGATIEEVDILDLQEAIDNIVDNEDIILVYENLIKGSRNHLRSFVKQIGDYEPIYLDKETYNSIISSNMERN